MDERHFKKVIKKAKANIPEINNRTSLDSLLNLFEAEIQLIEDWGNMTIKEFDYEKNITLSVEQFEQTTDLIEQYITKDGTQLITFKRIPSEPILTGEFSLYNSILLPIPQGLEPDFIWHLSYLIGNPKRDFVAYMATIMYQGHFSLPHFEEFHEFDWDTRVKELLSTKKIPKRYDMEDQALFMRWYTYRDQVQIAISNYKYEGSKTNNLYRKIISTLKDPVIQSCYFDIQERPSIVSKIRNLLK